MKYTITFNENLPFQPESNQVIYIGADDNAYATRVVRNSYEFIKRKFADFHLEFVFLPMLLLDADVERKVRYYAPYLQSQVVETTPLSSSLLLNYLAQDSKNTNIESSFIYKGRRQDDGWVFDAVTLDISDHDGISFLGAAFEHVVEDIFLLGGMMERCIKPMGDIAASINHFDEDLQCCYELDDFTPSSVSEPKHDERQFPLGQKRGEEVVKACSTPCPPSKHSLEFKAKKEKKEKKDKKRVLHDFFHRHRDDLPSQDAIIDFTVPSRPSVSTEPEPYEESDQNVGEILSDLQSAVSKLRLRGVTLMAIHELIDKQEPLSRLVITPDYRLFLPDYNNIEIEMGTLPKAVFFLFLRYPEGIVLKTLPDHYTELLNIYRQLRPKANEERLRVTITKVTNPLGNAINENVARIRKAFVEKFDEHLAQNYFVRGERAGLYGISLAPSLIVWEE